ncbi:hypothetical protein [Rhizobium sp. NXC24]|uniref:hypothetical protein n=1 Tax=Rhizobium sp. NXC24 TaxID=2048897 RepID=UPI00131A59F4|nr:hypothetical protein [Rhizobium sp. NXC24]
MTPSFDMVGTDETNEAATRSRLASIIANFKCELFQATNSSRSLPLYYNTPKYSGESQLRPLQTKNEEQEFTLKNIFSAIEYIGGVSVTMDATNTVGSSAKADFSKWGAAKYPLSLNLDASISEASHLQNHYYFSADFSRLVGDNPSKAHFYPRIVDDQAQRTSAVPGCGGGNELEGKLRLFGTLANGIMLGDENDISVWPGNADYPAASKTALDSKYSGEIDTTVDFTTTSSFAGGPTWEFTHVSLPNGNDGLLNARRVARNELSAVFFPICITAKYHVQNKSAPYEYNPHLPFGTPRWANYLPQCGTQKAVENKIDLFRHAIDTIKQRQIEF